MSLDTVFRKGLEVRISMAHLGRPKACWNRTLGREVSNEG